MRHRSGGTISLELAILAIPLIALMMLMWAFGVFAQAESLTDQAARDAVRAATQSRSQAEAEEKLAEAIAATMGSSEYLSRYVTCDDPVPEGLDGFETQPIFSVDTMRTVTVTLRCEVDLSAASFLPLGDPKVIESTFVSPLDNYRGYYS
jgi:Flp pilus assembly protein TadG